ncbi:MAG: Asp-tRNA(Asn)/Glu-tRNA(Gln) amidotransferase subunit GatB [SAR202 cluster bacterium]|nr:Asp-tRNA(Asn)/Glu-tRNA(Gln) amidotransferase subunit GatB [SAR202 cluster bacterium]
MEYEAVIGLETHVQLKTQSKMFGTSSAKYQTAEPNTLVDEVSMALPGTLPVVNQTAVEYAMMIGMAINCNIARVTKFDRKNYTYPDLMKGYQITQFDEPICYEGYIDLPLNDPIRVRINRVHMEEDVARLVHVEGAKGGTVHSLIDINRAGTPLMEVVTEPDLHTSEQVEAYINTLQHIIRYLGVGTANMEEGSFRCDANISVRPKGSTELTTKVEVKNMNRIRAVVRAVEYEIERQISAYKNGERIVQETRGWDDGKGVTNPQRSKEEANDYRYFPEPDIPPLLINEEWIEEIRAKMPELPIPRKLRFMSEWGLSEYDANLLTVLRSTADYFEAICDGMKHESPDTKKAFAKAAANWLNGEMVRKMNDDDLTNMFDTKISPDALRILVEKFRNRELNNNSAKQVFELMYTNGSDPEKVIQQLGLGVVSGVEALGPIVEEVIRNNEKAVNDYLSGKEVALKSLMGQVMKSTKGQADPMQATEMIKAQLSNQSL